MKLFHRKLFPNGREHIYFLGIKIFSHDTGKTEIGPDGNYDQWLRNRGVKVGKNCHIWGQQNLPSEPYFIEIGDNTMIAFGCTFLTHDGSINACEKLVTDFSNLRKLGRVTIGTDCFIGCQVIFLPGVTIGNNCVIGAGSVVTKNVPDGEVWAGNPAHFITTTKKLAKKLEKQSNSEE